MTLEEKDEFTKAVVQAVHESFSTNTPSIGTQEMFQKHQEQLDDLTEAMGEVTTKVDKLLELLGNLKFSGKMVFWVGTGIIGIVTFFEGCIRVSEECSE